MYLKSGYFTEGVSILIGNKNVKNKKVPGNLTSTVNNIFSLIVCIPLVLYVLDLFEESLKILCTHY